MNQNYIFRFDIPMQNFIFVHKLQSVKQIANDKGGSFLRKRRPIGDDIKKLTIAAQLQHNIDVIFVVEVPQHFDYVWMVEKDLNFQLSNKLHNKIVLYYSLLLHHFQPHDHASHHLAGQVHASEFPLPKFFDKLEILFTESFFSCGFELGR